MKRGKKRFFIIWALLCAALFSLLSLPASAAGGGETEVEELGLTLKPIRGWMEFTRGMPENDPIFETYPEIDKRIMDSVFLRDDIYYNAVYAEDGSKEILITMVESGDLFDWNDFSDDAYRSYAEQILSGKAAEAAGVSGASFTEYKMIDHPQCRWMKLYGEIENETDRVKLVEYATIVNGRHYNVMLRSSNSLIMPSEEAQFDEFVQSVRFSEILPAPFSLTAFVQSKHFLLYVIPAGVFVAAVIALVVVLALRRRRKKRKALRKEEPDYVEVEEQRVPFVEELPPFDSAPEGFPEPDKNEKREEEARESRKAEPPEERPAAPVVSSAFSGLSSLIEELPPFDAQQPEKEGDKR